MVARAVYGSRGDPLAVLHDLGQHLAQTPPDEVPDRIVRVLRESLKLSWVALDVEQDGTFTRAAEQGVTDSSSTVERFDLSFAGEVPGRLLVQPRRGERTLGRLDRRLIRHVADQAGPAVAAGRYVTELTLSRERLVLRPRGGTSSAAPRPARRSGSSVGGPLARVDRRAAVVALGPGLQPTRCLRQRHPRRARPGATCAESSTTCDRPASRSWDWSGRLKSAAGH